MKLFAVAAVLGLATPVFSYTQTYTLSYDTTYDDGQNSLKNVACSNGEYGLLTRGYTTFDDIPTFPNIGAAPQIQGANSPYCGSCWELTYTDTYGISTSLNLTAIDTCTTSNSDAFTISLEGMDYITQGQGAKLKSVPITVTRKAAGACGL
jgi:hypothetical protein